MIKYIKNWVLPLLILSVTTWSCVDRQFDEPPVSDFPTLTANFTIAELKAMHTLGSDTYEQVTEDKIISAVVTADDQSGNFYRNIVVQDETGGLFVRMRSSDLYTSFPVGRRVFIKLQGLFIGDYNNLYQLSGDSEGNAIESALIESFVVGGAFDQYIEPEVVTINDLTADKVGKLIKLENVEFAAASANQPFAVSGNNFPVNHDITDCNDNTAIVRTSTYADFSTELTPQGNGSLIAIYSVYRDTKQLIIRNTADLDMTGTRCSGGGSTGSEQLISIADVRAMYSGTEVVIPDERKIKGVVISDLSNGNIDGRNMVIQDATAGIVIRFEGTHAFALGAEVEVVISNQAISDFNGLVQIANTPNANASSTGSGTLPTPTVVTTADLNGNIGNYESTLIRINMATISGGGTLGGNLTVTDAAGSIPMYTKSGASFAGNPTPTGEVDVIAIASQFNSPQINIRKADDIIGGGGTGGDPELMDIADLRAAFVGGATSAPALRKISGVVISDAASGNITGRNLVLQGASGGIVIRFNDVHAFALGEQLEINVSSLELSEYNGLLQVNNVPNSNVLSNTAGTLPTPQEVTIADILANSEAMESTLVKITGVTIAEGGTYSGSKTVTDSSGNIPMYTRAQATFADTNVPSGTFNIVAIVSQFNDEQLNIRNLDDIQ